MSEGWIALHRGWRDNPIFKGEFSRADAWIWLIEAACWKPTRYDIKGKTVLLQRGQVCVSREQMATAWKWSPSAVERFLARLQTEQMIERQTGQGKSVITICNYAKYQDRAEQTGQESEQQTGQESDRDRTAKEQGNKETSIGEEAKASPPRRAKPVPKVRMVPEWVPGPLPPHIAELVAQWPPGRLHREVEDFRAYWIERGEKRPGWDRSFHSRISDIHERVLRDARNGRHSPPAHGIAAALDRRIEPREPARSPGRYDAGDGGDYRALPAPKVASL